MSQELAVFYGGLDFILTHLDDPLWPRTIMTAQTRVQVTVNSKEEALRYFEQADYVDCRISAYPKYDFCFPDMIFVDLDRKQFKSDLALKLALSKTRTNMHERLGGGIPSVLWTGNGYHIYQPTTIFPYYGHAAFDKFDDIAPNLNTAWMRFTAMTLSNGKHDPDNTQSTRNCMLRIPGSYNGKCIINGRDPEVKVIQQWDNKRPDVRLLLGDFVSYLTSKKLKRMKELEKRQRQSITYDGNGIFWIERLLQTPISDARKNTIRLVLAPYLMTIKKLDEYQADKVISSWLGLCDSVKSLERRYPYAAYIKSCLRASARLGLKPLSLANLEDKLPTLHESLFNVKEAQT